MARVAIGDAFGAGLRLIQRRPLVPLVWGLVYFVCAYVPAIASMAMMMPILTQSMHPGTVPTDPSQIMAQMAPLQLMNLVQIAFSVVGFAIINAAVCRAVLEPENDRSFYLRLGAQELWQGLVLLVLYVLIGFAVFAAFVPVIIIGVVGGIAVANGGQSGLAMIPVIVLLVIAAMVAIGSSGCLSPGNSPRAIRLACLAWAPWSPSSP
jgi:small-conductance mechanosensitive channel